jgi:glucarate dehydratase
MKIVDIRAATVTVPLEAPLHHANGVHWERFVRTIVEVETDTGIVVRYETCWARLLEM